jgi:hypothetical protein
MRGLRAVFVLGAAALLGVVALTSRVDAVPGDVALMASQGLVSAPGRYPRGAAITCVPPNAFNPDAGLGQATVGALKGGYTSFNFENESATAAYWCWRSGTTKANYTTACVKRCNGCAGGISYTGEVTNAGNDLFCIAGVATDAGIVVAGEVTQ